MIFTSQPGLFGRDRRYQRHQVNYMVKMDGQQVTFPKHFRTSHNSIFSAEPWFDRSLIEAKQVFRLEFFDRDETGVNAILEIRFYILRFLLNK